MASIQARYLTPCMTDGCLLTLTDLTAVPFSLSNLVERRLTFMSILFSTVLVFSSTESTACLRT